MQFNYQHDVQIVLKNKSKMRNAEREIDKVCYAFDILRENNFPVISRTVKALEDGEEEKVQVAPIIEGSIPSLKTLKGHDETVLIIDEYNGRFKGWHPMLRELDLKEPYNPNKQVPKANPNNKDEPPKKKFEMF